MAYAAYAAQSEYSEPSEGGFLGGASAKGAKAAHARGLAGEVTIDENQHKIAERAADEARVAQREAARNTVPQDNQPADGDAPQQAQQQQPSGSQQRMAMSPALKGPAAPTNS